jgi:hypothetical protein
MEFGELQNKVLLVLEKYEEIRSDDFKLYFHVCRSINENVAIMDRFSYVMLNHKELGFPSFESVTRYRRKVFELHPNLKPEKVTKFRKEKEEEFREYSKRKV